MMTQADQHQNNIGPKHNLDIDGGERDTEEWKQHTIRLWYISYFKDYL